VKLDPKEVDVHEFYRKMVTLVYHFDGAKSPNGLQRDGGSGFVVEVDGEW
jgi:hypothetical protein